MYYETEVTHLQITIAYKDGLTDVTIDGKPVAGVLSFTLECNGYERSFVFRPVIDLAFGHEMRLNGVANEAGGNRGERIQRE